VGTWLGVTSKTGDKGEIDLEFFLDPFNSSSGLCESIITWREPQIPDVRRKYLIGQDLGQWRDDLGTGTLCGVFVENGRRIWNSKLGLGGSSGLSQINVPRVRWTDGMYFLMAIWLIYCRSSCLP
jgi:hypothetical protein